MAAMRIGVLLIPADPWPVSVARARRIEELGFDHLWTYDHLSWQRYRDRPWHAAIPWLAGIAAATSRIRLGTMVSSPNFRHPVTLAKEAMTLDHISGGRLTLGIGAGGTGFDATVLGGEVLPPGRRAARLDDFVATVDGLLRNPAYSTRTGSYTVDEARMIPGCVQQPRVPLAVAAAGRRTMATVARYADSWVTFGDPSATAPTVDSTRAAVRHQRRLLETACGQAGRRLPDSVFLAGSSGDRPLASLAAFEDLLAWATSEGFTDLVLHDPRPDDPQWAADPRILEQIARSYLPRAAPSPHPGSGPR